MESYLQLDSISKAFGADELLTDVTFSVAEGEKIGLIAKNGSGKTTLLNIIAGIESPDSGTIVTRRGLRIGYLQQLPSLEGDTVMACCPTSHGDGWDVEQQFKKLLTMLKIDDLSQPVSQLSGGQVKRVALAQLLLHEPQLLILDEPTNHLDIDIIEWLENYLQRSRMTLLMVTHDRYFLDTVWKSTSTECIVTTAITTTTWPSVPSASRRRACRPSVRATCCAPNWNGCADSRKPARTRRNTASTLSTTCKNAPRNGATTARCNST